MTAPEARKFAGPFDVIGAVLFMALLVVTAPIWGTLILIFWGWRKGVRRYTTWRAIRRLRRDLDRDPARFERLYTIGEQAERRDRELGVRPPARRRLVDLDNLP